MYNADWTYNGKRLIDGIRNQNQPVWFSQLFHSLWHGTGCSVTRPFGLTREAPADCVTRGEGNIVTLTEANNFFTRAEGVSSRVVSSENLNICVSTSTFSRERTASVFGFTTTTTLSLRRQQQQK